MKEYIIKEPHGTWEVHRNMFIMANEFLNTLDIKNEFYFDQVLHGIIWHRGLDPVRWILENKDLVKKIATESSVDLTREIKLSLIKLTKY